MCLMKARPDLTPGQGKDYLLDITPFRAGDIRFQAYVAGQIDGGTTSFSTLMLSALKGIRTTTVAAISKESNRTYSTSFLSLTEGGINSAKDLKGKVIGIPGLRNTFELIARAELSKIGLNPDRDVRLVVVPTQVMEQALRDQKISIGAFVQPFYANAIAGGGVKVLFNSINTLGLAEEFNIFFQPEFLKSHDRVIRSFLSDFVASTKYYIANTGKARKALLASKMVEIPASVFIGMANLEPVPDARPSPADWEKMQDWMFKLGFMDQKVDINSMIDTSYLPN